MKKGEKASKKLLEIMHSQEYRNKIRLANLKNWKNKKIREKRIKGIRKTARSEYFRNLQRKIAKKSWTKEKKDHFHKIWNKEKREKLARIWTEIKRNKLSNKLKRFFAKNPNSVNIMRRKLKERYKAHPYLRIKLSREKQRYYETHPGALKNLVNYSKQEEKKIKADGNIFVKSQGEKIINNILFEAGINPRYEQIELNFPEMDPVPDFFPEGECEFGKIRKVFIEFYGGHPKSWENKVRKNKLYQKYNIPVLILTPYEIKLENFREYLLKELVKLSKSEKARKFNLSRWEI